MSHRFGFLPHARNSVAANAAVSGMRLSSTFDVAIVADGAEQGSRLAIDATLRGPGDVIGISNNQIVRYEPAPGQRGCEPNYFPFVEFVDVDFPWRYSLQTGNPRRLNPWLALIALKEKEFDLVSQGRGPLPRLIVHSIADSLPNLNQAWAWAHVQVNLDGANSKTTAEKLAEDPANGFARLFCCRRLHERTRYHLFVVPIYEAGRMVGLGREVADVGDDFAWQNAANESVELPYYSHSEFVTDATADIEQLVRKLRAFKADAGDETGSPMVASANRPGYYSDYQGNRQRFEIQTALMQVDSQVQRYNTDQPLAQRMIGTLNEVISGEGDDTDEDPLVAFPPYGFRFRQETEVSLQKARNGSWFDRVNLDLKMRHAAARGAAVVRQNQEEYAKAAWDQYDAVMEANQKLRQLRVAQKLVQQLTAKHLQKLSPDVVTVLAEPMQPYVRINQSGKGQSITQSLSVNGSPGVYASRGLRRVAAKRPVKAVRQNKGTQIPSPGIKGDVSSSPISRRKSVPALVDGPNKVFSGLRLTGRVADHYTAMFGPGVLRTKSNKTELLVRECDSVAFARAVANTMQALPKLKSDFIINGQTKDEQKNLNPLWRSPRIPLPMAPALTNLARDAILPNVGDLPNNTVSLFVENRHFIEAFMVGVNHAMNDELRWREFPTDMRGTIFDRFWDRGAALGDMDSADIIGIHAWTKRLGSNHNPTNPDGNEALVIVIKGDIVRKLGDPVIVVNQHKGSNWSPGKGTNFEPVFFGKMGRETAYFGFDLNRKDVVADPNKYRLVIYEPMGRLRFGLDVGSAKVRQQRQNINELSLKFPMKHRDLAVNTLPIQPQQKPVPARDAIPDWDDLSWQHVNLSSSGYINFAKIISTQNGANLWGRNKTSASLARSFWQKPVAAVLPFIRILP